MQAHVAEVPISWRTRCDGCAFRVGVVFDRIEGNPRLNLFADVVGAMQGFLELRQDSSRLLGALPKHSIRGAQAVQ